MPFENILDSQLHSVIKQPFIRGLNFPLYQQLLKSEELISCNDSQHSLASLWHTVTHCLNTCTCGHCYELITVHANIINLVKFSVTALSKGLHDGEVTAIVSSSMDPAGKAE